MLSIVFSRILCNEIIEYTRGITISAASILCCISSYAFLWLSGILWCVYTTISLPIHLLTDHRVVWWLILRVNLTGLKDVQIAGKTMFLGVAPRLFPEKMSIWISKLSKEGHSHQCGQAPSNPLRAGIEQKGGGRAVCPLSSLWDVHLFLCSDSSSWFLGFQTQPELYYWLFCIFRQQTVGLLGLHNLRSQFPNKLQVYIFAKAPQRGRTNIMYETYKKYTHT